ncbi:hypothetical protein F8S09_13285 [Deinococcus sp. SDU3-2]|uniref:Uncharacterized protein n=1 Tax=Deinococcus terrestris TaxID=2651870 RepID=A0A7X1TSN7_9DEIO|nr:hypothetical protein [Deinococcus terrestris]MPY67646.1 hypothetical protein [Deinococcus terrestris]
MLFRHVCSCRGAWVAFTPVEAASSAESTADELWQTGRTRAVWVFPKPASPQTPSADLGRLATKSASLGT